MKPSTRLPWIAPLLAGLGAITLPAAAAPFLYRPGDLVLTLRQPGAPADLVVNLGPVGALSTLPPDSSVALTNLTPALIATTFADLNGVRWSVGAANRPPVVPEFPLQTLWLTAARTEPAQPAPPWLRKGQFVQGTAASQVDAVGANAALASNLLPAGPSNTATAVAVPLDSPFAVSPVIGDDANYVGTFQGPVENVTPDDFSTAAGSVSRSDFFELLPGTTAAGTLNQPGRLLGTFALSPDGALTFSNASPAPAAPVITAIARAGEVTTVTFNTVAGTTYQLRASAAGGITTPLASWEAGPSVAGDGTARSLQFTDSNTTRFFVIEARR